MSGIQLLLLELLHMIQQASDGPLAMEDCTMLDPIGVASEYVAFSACGLLP